MFRNDIFRTVAIIAMTLVTSATMVVGAVGPAQADAGHRAAIAAEAAVVVA